MERCIWYGLTIILSCGGTVQTEIGAQLKYEADPKNTIGKGSLVEHVLYPEIMVLDHENHIPIEVEQHVEELKVNIKMVHHDTQEEMDFDVYHSMLEAESARHMQEVANDSKKKDIVQPEDVPTEPEHKPEVRLVSDHLETEQRPHDESVNAGDKANSVKLDGQIKKTVPYVYMKPLPAPVEPHEMPDIIVHHQEEEDLVDHVVFVHTDRHEHVVHKERDYASLLRHDEM